ncbi:hypothetical protein AB0G02_23375, partial [Actinosynnema sp. NPDC023658]|uniref:hypothetical protein n=1 Tax=Actinosynnema sp. NPDC023658 TaxID=3155465 RepID=UPI0033FCE632
MTENEQPDRPPQSQQPQPQSPWARGGTGPGHDDAGFQQQGAGRPEVTDGSAAGVDRSDVGPAGASQGSTGRPVEPDGSLYPDSVSTTAAGHHQNFGSPAAHASAGEPVPGSPAAHRGAGHPEDFRSPAATQGAA